LNYFLIIRIILSLIFHEDPLILSSICLKLMETIHLICEYTLLREQNNLENCYNEKEIYLKSHQTSQNRRDPSRMPLFFQEEADILFYCQEFLLSIINCSFDLLELIYSFPQLERILSSGLILSDNFLLKEKFSTGLSDLFRAYCMSEIVIKPHQFFIPILVNNVLDLAFQHEERSEMFFSLLIGTLDEIPVNKEVVLEKKCIEFQKNVNFQVDFPHLIKKLVFIIQNRKFEENQEKDILLTCSLNLIKVLLNYLSEDIEEISNNMGLVDELLFNCLFFVKNGLKSNHSNYKCKSYNSRTAAFNLLHALSVKSERNLKKVLDFFLPLIRDCDWRTKSNSDWNITPKINEKSQTGYVGLKNLGCSKRTFF